jgi:hypothetical protein
MDRLVLEIILYGNKIIFVTLTNQAGYGSNKSIVPIACNEIFDEILDLVVPQNRLKGRLKVREHSKVI